MTRPLLGLVGEVLDERAAAAGRDPLVAEFRRWLNRDGSSLAVEAEHLGLWRYQDVALAGIHAARAGGTGTFVAGMTWLVGRPYFQPNRTPGLEADPLALFAVALGVRAGSDETHRVWVREFVAQAAGGETDPWRRSLIAAAGLLAGDQGWERIGAELAVALEARGIGEVSDAAREMALAAIVSGYETASDERAVVMRVALDRLVAMEARVDLRRPSVDDVVAVLREVPAALKRWPWESTGKTKNSAAQRWDLPSEYHVQSLLWAILRPLFPDLKDEEYLKSLGYTHPRVDLCIPSLRLIIEVKFARESTQGARAKVETEVSADTGFYLSRDTGYDRIIAFVWDSVGAVQHHATMEAGLAGLQGVVAAVVVARPGDWK